MSKTMDLFEATRQVSKMTEDRGEVFARARRADPSTSQQSAGRAGEFAEDHYGKILKALELVPGTIYTIGTTAGLDHVAVARRLPELQKLGKVVPTGATEAGPFGHKCRVWRKT